jgi:hypothetical protein
MLREYFGEILFHSPERSGLPSGVRGAGAARFGCLGCAGFPAWAGSTCPSGALTGHYNGDRSGFHGCDLL